jgi:hypothetical protein
VAAAKMLAEEEEDSFFCASVKCLGHSVNDAPLWCGKTGDGLLRDHHDNTATPRDKRK